MGQYDLSRRRAPAARSRCGDKTNHYVTGRDGGRDIDLRDFALRGVSLYGTFQNAVGATLELAPDLATNLDAADAVYDSINRSIDAFIEKRAIEAPPPTRYVAPWAPARETTALDLGSTGITSVIWAIGFRTQLLLGRLSHPRRKRTSRARPRRHAGTGALLPRPALAVHLGLRPLLGVGRDAAYVGTHIAQSLALRLGEVAHALSQPLRSAHG